MTVLTVMVCARTSVKYLLITLIFPITFFEHFLHLNWLFLTVDIENDSCVFSRVNFLIAVLTVSACIF